jgi:hypothetical protein
MEAQYHGVGVYGLVPVPQDHSSGTMLLVYWSNATGSIPAASVIPTNANTNCGARSRDMVPSAPNYVIAVKF